MPKFKNETSVDQYRFRMHFAAGQTVDVPDDLDPDKLAALRVHFTEITEPEAEPVPKVVPRKTTKRRRSTFRTD